MTYTQLDLLSSVTKPGDGAARTSTMTSTPHHLAESMTSPKQTKTIMGYDELDRLISVSKQGTDTAEVRTLMTYDLLGRMTSMTDPEGKKTQYTYDQQSRIIEVINHE